MRTIARPGLIACGLSACASQALAQQEPPRNPSDDGRKHVPIYALATTDYRGGAATGWPEFDSLRNCEDARKRLEAAVAQQFGSVDGPQVERHAVPQRHGDLQPEVGARSMTTAMDKARRASTLYARHDRLRKALDELGNEHRP